jgi:hypothetical protein
MKFPQKKSLIFFALLAGLVLSPAGRARADHTSDAIFRTFGYVRDPLGNPVAGVAVNGDNYVGDVYPGMTLEDGYYEIIFPIDGNYRVTVDCGGLAALGFGCIDPVSMTQEGDPVHLDFTVTPSAGSLQVTNTALPKGNVTAPYSVHLGAGGGNPPYTWQLAPDSPALPPGLTLNGGGHISGTPTTNNLFAIKVQVTDAGSVITNKILFITVNRQPMLLTPVWRTNRFTMRLFGAADQNYTIQMATNLSTPHWISLYATNNLNSSSYIVADPQATNRQRFYRVLIGP